MSAPGTPTIDQLRILIAIADSGSFSEAGRRLNRAQSVISYTLANLEQQLGLALFHRGRRRPTLTDAGTALLAEARRVTDAVDTLRARAAGLLRGLESEVSVAIDVMYPTPQLVVALEAFAATYPTVTLRLRIEALGAVIQLVRDTTCILGVSGWLATRHPDLDIRAIGSTEMIAVASPAHRLAHLPAPIPLAELRDDIQLVLTDRSPLSAGEDFGVRARRTWRLGDMAAKHALLRAGLGWGNMPTHMVAEDLVQNRLIHLDVADSTEQPYPLLLIHPRAAPLGPAASWLADRLAAAVAGSGRATTSPLAFLAPPIASPPAPA